MKRIPHTLALLTCFALGTVALTSVVEAQSIPPRAMGTHNGDYYTFEEPVTYSDAPQAVPMPCKKPRRAAVCRPRKDDSVACHMPCCPPDYSPIPESYDNAPPAIAIPTTSCGENSCESRNVEALFPDYVPLQEPASMCSPRKRECPSPQECSPPHWCPCPQESVSQSCSPYPQECPPPGWCPSPPYGPPPGFRPCPPPHGFRPCPPPGFRPCPSSPGFRPCPPPPVFRSCPSCPPPQQCRPYSCGPMACQPMPSPNYMPPYASSCAPMMAPPPMEVNELCGFEDCSCSCYRLYLGALAFNLRVQADNDTLFHNRFCDTRGPMYGAAFVAEYSKLWDFYQQLTFNWAIGKLDRENEEAHWNKRQIHYYQGEWHLGYTLDCGFLFSPYIGYGCRYTDEEMDHSWKLRYLLQYVPLGGKAELGICSWMSLGLDIACLIPVSATAKIQSLDHTRMTLKKHSGISVELPISYHSASHAIALVLTPFFHRLVEGSSEHAVFHHHKDAHLPRQTDQEWGAKLLLSVGF